MEVSGIKKKQFKDLKGKFIFIPIQRSKRINNQCLIIDNDSFIFLVSLKQMLTKSVKLLYDTSKQVKMKGTSRVIACKGVPHLACIFI